jgi:aconitate hydratase
VKEPSDINTQDDLLDAPLPRDEAAKIVLRKGPNIVSIPEMDSLPDTLELPVLLKVGDNISTDEILAGGARVLPFRSNLPEISKFTYEAVDASYVDRAMDQKKHGGHAIVGGFNYGQGSSREHAALAPRYLGLRAVIVKDYARIHWQNLINFGILPLRFADESDYNALEQEDVLSFTDLRSTFMQGSEISANLKNNKKIKLTHDLSPRQKDIILHGGLINYAKAK